jgi:hypothetical protein
MMVRVSRAETLDNSLFVGWLTSVVAQGSTSARFDLGLLMRADQVLRDDDFFDEQLNRIGL